MGPVLRQCLFVVLLLSLARTGTAADAESEKLEQAKSSFREGVALLRAGDPERALERFLRSRELVPSSKNTANAAICLERLGRLDEALELYEELLVRFSKDLDQQDRENLGPTMASLRQRLASLELSANVEGHVVVDGKPRGDLPRSTPLRLLPGPRRVRIVKDGYATFERVVDLEAGQTATLDAELQPLSGLGAIRVEEANGAVVDVYVDGERVGKTPWEGTLPVGSHVLQGVAGERGSMPQVIQSVERRTGSFRVATRPLGPPLRITPFPSEATLILEGQRLGRGDWLGRLPVGNHHLKAEAAGYFSKELTVSSSEHGVPTALGVVLEKDPEHPRWPKPITYQLRAGAGAGLLYAPTLNGGHEDECPSLCARSRAALGARFELTFGVQHDSGVEAELAGGYAFAHQDFSRAVIEASAGSQVTYALSQELAMGGPYGRVALALAAKLPLELRLRGTVGFGLLAATYESSATGAAWTTGELAPAAVTGLSPVSKVDPFVTSSLDLERDLGPVTFWFSLGAWFFPTEGPTFEQAELVVAPNCPASPPPDAVGCVPASERPRQEPTHGPFAFFAPALGARYRF